jgi:lipid II:glycine glycyltransferase (peptidoglycan interpeptide bridge formation enzyme)
MRAWEEIIHTGIIGTDKKAVNTQIFSEELLPLFEKLEKEAEDKEDFFLSLSSVIYNYRRGSFLPQKETVTELRK